MNSVLLDTGSNIILVPHDDFVFIIRLICQDKCFYIDDEQFIREFITFDEKYTVLI